MKRDNRKVDWKFRRMMTTELFFMVEKRIDAIIEKYTEDVLFYTEILDQPPRILITLWCNTEDQLLKTVEKFEELSMFDVFVYPNFHSEREEYQFKRMFVLKYKFDEYSYQKEK